MNGARGALLGIYQGNAGPALPEFVCVDIPGYKGVPVITGVGAGNWDQYHL